MESGAWTNTDSHIGGRIDSYYEYLLKGWLLFGDEDYRHMWEVSRPPSTASSERWTAISGTVGST